MYEEEVRFAFRQFVRHLHGGPGTSPQRQHPPATKVRLSLKSLCSFLRAIGVYDQHAGPGRRHKGPHSLFYDLAGGEEQDPEDVEQTSTGRRMFSEADVCRIVAEMSNSEMERIAVETALAHCASKSDFLRAARSIGQGGLKLTEAEGKFLGFLVQAEKEVEKGPGSEEEEGRGRNYEGTARGRRGMKGPTSRAASELDRLKTYLGYA